MRAMKALASINLLWACALLVAIPAITPHCSQPIQLVETYPTFHCQPWHTNVGNIFFNGERWECGGDNRFPDGTYLATVCEVPA